ncbi:MAG: response regulator [candidate division KSB1 bacterium]|nr:response regulator [candidate division KSB1 bacterium]
MKRNGTPAAHRKDSEAEASSFAMSQEPAVAMSLRRSECKILIVDDDEQFRRSLFKTLSRAGYRLNVATNDTEALESLAQVVFGVVIVDLNTQRAGWKNFLRRITSLRPSSRVIVVTPFAHDNLCDEVKDLGIFACLLKPFKREQLLDLVARASAASTPVLTTA